MTKKTIITSEVSTTEKAKKAKKVLKEDTEEDITSYKHSNVKDSAQFRYWCYTANNYTEEDINALKGLDTSYHVYGKEIGKKGTPHLQGYLEFAQKIRFSTLKRAVPHAFFKRRFTNDANKAAAYCKKGEGTPETPVNFNGEEIGIISTAWKKQGQRTDIHDYVEAMREDPHLDVLENFPHMLARYPKFVEYVKRRFTPGRSHVTPIIWLHGKSSTCKSRIAADIAKAHSDIPPFYKDRACKFWDGYEQEPVIIIDEYRSNPELSYQDLLRIGDRYPLSLQVKGSMTQFTSELVIITSSMSPYEAFSGIVGHNDHIAQLIRRISDCIDTDKDDTELDILDDDTILEEFTSSHYENRRSNTDISPEIYTQRINKSCPRRYRTKVLENHQK